MLQRTLSKSEQVFVNIGAKASSDVHEDDVVFLELIESLYIVAVSCSSRSSPNRWDSMHMPCAGRLREAAGLSMSDVQST